MITDTTAQHLRVDDTVGDMLNHPALSAFGRLLLPRDDRRVDANMPMRQVGLLLPYQTHVEELTIGFVPFSPLGKGFLTGKVDETTTFDETNRPPY